MGNSATLGTVAQGHHASFSGSVHGGQQPVTGAVVTLWAAGMPASGGAYGTGATAISSTLTDAQGNFNLDPATVTGINGYAIAGGVATFTTTSAGSYTTGQTVVLGGFPTSTFLNGQEVTVVASTPTSFTANFTSADVAATTESGTATYYNTTNSKCTAGQYLYVTATGGNPGLGGVYGTVNNANSALMAAFPTPCSVSNTGSTTVVVNEVSTVAAVTALQQFLKINTSGTEPTMTSTTNPPWTIGAPSTNAIGLANAFAGLTNLANIAGGTAASNSTPFGVASVVNGTPYTMNVQPDAQKINTMADVLSACVNTSGGSGVCSNLAADTTPSGAATPIDTVQMAYYLATNPAGLTMPAHGFAAAPYWQCANYVTSSAPFQPTYTCSSSVSTPSFYDWTVPVKWTLYNGTGTKLAMMPTSVAIDASGNIWTGGGSGYGTVSPINEFGVGGQYLLSGPTTVNVPAETLNYVQTSVSNPLAFPGQTGVSLTYGRQDGLAIDPSGNVYFVQNSPVLTPSTLTGTTAGTVSLGLIVEVPAGSPSASGAGILTGASAFTVAFGANSDLFVNDEPVSSRYYASSMPFSSGGYTTLNEGGGRATGYFQGIVVDQSGYATHYFNTATCSATASQVIPRNNAAGDAAQSVTPTTTPPNITLPFGQCANYGAVDPLGNQWISGTNSAASAAELAYVDLQTGAGSPIVTSVPVGTGGLTAPTGIAIDGAGNIWVSNGTTATAGVSEFGPSFITVGSGSDSLNTAQGTAILSPSANSTPGFAANFGTTKGPVIDPSGNVWLKVSGSTLAFIAGAAAPVSTPLVNELIHAPGTPGSIGNRP